MKYMVPGKEKGKYMNAELKTLINDSNIKRKRIEHYSLEEYQEVKKEISILHGKNENKIFEKLMNLKNKFPKDIEIETNKVNGKVLNFIVDLYYSSVHIRTDYENMLLKIKKVRQETEQLAVENKKLADVRFDNAIANNSCEIVKKEAGREKRVVYHEADYKESFINFCKNFDKIKGNGYKILMSGNAGTGKTYYTNCIYNELKEKYNVLYTNMSSLLKKMLPKENSKEKQWSIEEITEIIKNTDLIIFDDLGNEKISDYSLENMFLIFDCIDTENKAMIINTNLDSQKLKEHFQMQGDSKILDRIYAKNKVYLFKWTTRREKYKKEDELY